MLVTGKGKTESTQELVNASIQVLIDVLESGHSEVLTSYLKVMAKFRYTLVTVPGAQVMPTKQTRIVLLTAIISAVVAIVVAVIQFGPSWVSPKSGSGTPVTVGGRVVDIDTNAPVAGADISIGGKPSGYVSENNGNFRFSFIDSTSDHRVRIRVDKSGYLSWDRSIGVPAEDVIIQLQRNSK